MTRQQAQRHNRTGMVATVTLAGILMVHILIAVIKVNNIPLCIKGEFTLNAKGVVYMKFPTPITPVYIPESKLEKEFENWVKPQIDNLVPVYGRESIDYISLDDFELMAKTVFAEAKTEGFEGQVAVAEVILNRVESTNFPDTIEAVIRKDKAFASWCNGSVSDAPLDDECLEAVQEAVNKRLFPKSVVYFREGRFHSYGKPYGIIGKHYFSSEGDK